MTYTGMVKSCLPVTTHKSRAINIPFVCYGNFTAQFLYQGYILVLADKPHTHARARARQMSLVFYNN